MSLRLTSGGAIDRTRPLRFRFDGREYTGFAGDTLASALLANKVRVTGRSFKYHRPRGLMAAGFEEANTLVQLEGGARTEPNLKATQVELHEGLVARPVNCWPSARWDLMSIMQLFKPLLPAGFYYKTFIAPNWHLYEWAIRRSAGLGHSPRAADPDVYDKQYISADVLVVGAGPSGLAAAIAAAQAGAQVLLVDDRPQAGGSLSYEPGAVEQVEAAAWLHARRAEIAALDNVRVLSRTTVFGYYDHNQLMAVELPPPGAPGIRQRLWKIRAREVLLATGAIERPLVFPNNDRPGVMLAGAARQYLHRFGVAPGRRVVIATNNDSAYEAAFELHAAGIEIALIADARMGESAMVARAQALGLPVASGVGPTDALGAGGLHAVELHAVDGAGRAQTGTVRRLDADALLVSGGWNPTVHLFSQSGGRVRFERALQAFVPGQPTQRERSIGAAAGCLQRDLALAHARVAGEAAARGLAAAASPVAVDGSVQPLWSVDVEALGRTSGKSWVDFASDVTEADLRLAVRENFAAVEHLKRYTTTGMMADQGKTSNVNAIGILGGIVGRAPEDVGTTKFRPPFNPVTFGAVVGRNVGAFHRPLRRLPAHASHEHLGAAMEDYGAWLRPAYYRRDGESEAQAIRREVLAVRSAVGILDYSALGKILVRGPDAAELLQRIYVNNMRTLKVGDCRYGLMLGEDGIVKDDGVLTRWGEHSYVVGTTSGQAERIADWLEEWLQCEYVDLDVVVEPVTTQWATIMLAGPRARTVLARLCTGIELAPAAFPHMSAREGRIGEVPGRVMRVSFTGELGYEVSVPWSHGAALWEALLAAGRDDDLIPFGIESLMTLRIEKGFLHVGSDTDGMTLPQDVGFGAIIDKKGDDFVGRRSTMTPDAQRTDRRQLVGLAPLDGRTHLPVGGHVVDAKCTGAPAPTLGVVTSSVDSPTLGRPVAMALIERGRERLGEQVQVYDEGRLIAARIVPAAAYDPQGERLRT